MKKDITTKEAIQTITKDIATHILQLNIDNDIKFIDKELKRVEKREADIVALCKIDGKKSILHIEIQNNNDKTMPLRMLRYFVDIYQKYENLPVFQYLIYIGKDKIGMKNSIITTNMNYTYNIVDMHKIDCQRLLKLDSPDALVLAILCDFKNKDELDIITYILRRLKELIKDDENRLGKYLLILETFSQNRDLCEKLKEAEKMLRNIEYEKLPSYEIGLEDGLEKGLEKGKIESAIIMIDRYGINIKDVSKDLGLPVELLKKRLKSKK